MNRRDFIKVSGTGTLLGAGMLPVFGSTLPGTDAPGFTEAARKINVEGNYDVVVCGAGPAGIAAAIEAGRSGASVLLVEVNGCLGGVWTAGLLSWILDQKNKPGLMRELEDRLIKMNAKSAIDTGHRLAFDIEKMKLLLEEMCMEAKVDVLLHARVVAVGKSSKNRLTHIITESKSGREAWAGRQFIDCTGDGDLAARSGCRFDFGTEGTGEYQPMSMLGIIAGVQFDDIKEYVRWAGDPDSASKKKLLGEIVKSGLLPSYTLPGIYPIHKDLFMLMANHEYAVSGLNSRDITKGTIQGRAELHKIVDGLRSVGGPWQNIRLVSTAEQIGIREGRRIHGLYTVTKNDLINGVRHNDAVCRVTFGVDVHSVSKENELKGSSYGQDITVKPYDIPVRALIAKDVGGLLMAGRCISGDFISHSSYRVTGNAVAMGQAVGRLAAVAAKQHKLPQDIPFNSLGISV